MILAMVDKDTEYLIEKVIRHKMIDGKKHSLIRWKHYSDKFNSWIPSSTIQKYK